MGKKIQLEMFYKSGSQTSVCVGKLQGQNSQSVRVCSHPGKNNFLGMMSALPDCCLSQKSSHEKMEFQLCLYAG